MQPSSTFSRSDVWAFGANASALLVLVIGALAFVAEVVGEFDHPISSVDDAAVVLLGVLGLIWFLYGTNKYALSTVPIWMLFFALLVKFIWIFIEMRVSPDDVGDDIPGVIVFFVATIFVGIFYAVARSRRET